MALRSGNMPVINRINRKQNVIFDHECSLTGRILLSISSRVVELP